MALVWRKKERRARPAVLDKLLADAALLVLVAAAHCRGRRRGEPQREAPAERDGPFPLMVMRSAVLRRLCGPRRSGGGRTCPSGGRRRRQKVRSASRHGGSRQDRTSPVVLAERRGRRMTVLAARGAGVGVLRLSGKWRRQSTGSEMSPPWTLQGAIAALLSACSGAYRTQAEQHRKMCILYSQSPTRLSDPAVARTGLRLLIA